jgi:hypothetical protein
MPDAPTDDPPETGNGRGGYRPGAGRKPQPKPYALSPSSLSNHSPQTPLEYLLSVLNDPSQPPGRRIRCAIAAAPFVHPRIVPLQMGKKEATAAAARTVGLGDWQGDL